MLSKIFDMEKTVHLDVTILGNEIQWKYRYLYQQVIVYVYLERV